MYSVVLRCTDGSLYIGHTSDLSDRLTRHNEGRADCSFSINRRPVAVVYSETFDSRAAAVRRERQLKGWTRRKKEALIAGDLARLKVL
jgi:predicted GIY-YIG superfamily endonuclease